MMLKRILLVMLLGLLMPPLWAADENGGAAADYVNYIELKPFIANFNTSGKLRFLKCGVTIQVSSPAAHHAVNYHKPAIRHAVLMLLSAKHEEEISTVDAQHLLAQEALKEIQQILLKEEGEAFVSDLFFTSFVIQ